MAKKSKTTAETATPAETPRAEAPKAGAKPKAGKKAAKEKPKAKPAKDAKPKKTSALDAAARVLAEEAKPMNCQEIIAAMAAKGYWTSPGGQTPHATLYSAILSEMTKKAEAARFQKVERGKFALRNG